MACINISFFVNVYEIYDMAFAELTFKKKIWFAQQCKGKGKQGRLLTQQLPATKAAYIELEKTRVPPKQHIPSWKRHASCMHAISGMSF